MSQAVVPTWTQLPTSTQSAPPPLTGHVAVVWRNEFIVHGGGTDEGEASDRTYFYDLDARRWVAQKRRRLFIVGFQSLHVWTIVMEN